MRGPALIFQQRADGWTTSAKARRLFPTLAAAEVATGEKPLDLGGKSPPAYKLADKQTDRLTRKTADKRRKG